MREGPVLEVLACLGCPHAKEGCSYDFPHSTLSPVPLHHLHLLPFILTYTSCFPSTGVGEMRNFCSCSTQESWVLTRVFTWSRKGLINFSDCLPNFWCLPVTLNYTPSSPRISRWVAIIATVLISKTYKRIRIPFCLGELWVDPSVNSAWLLPVLFSSSKGFCIPHMLQLKYFIKRFNSKQKRGRKTA